MNKNYIISVFAAAALLAGCAGNNTNTNQEAAPGTLTRNLDNGK